jgi:GR25 family glycosyltransferase involved in LPS biosynthesis
MTPPSYLGRYINLERSSQRRVHIEAELRKMPVAYDRFAAIDGGAASERPDVSDRGAVGCFLSHLGVLEAGVDAGLWLHVLEDDAVVSRAAPAAVSAVMTSEAFCEYDIVFTNIRYPEAAELTRRLQQIFDQSVVTDEAGDVLSVHAITPIPLAPWDFRLTTSYLVNPTAIEHVVRLLAARLHAHPFLPIDDALSALSRQGELKAAVTLPFFTLPLFNAPSTITPLSARPWAIGHRIKEAALYADRRVEDLWAMLEALLPGSAPSVTGELIASAYRYLLRVS